MKNAILLILIFHIMFQGLVAQEKVAGEKIHKNTFRFNITNPLIFSSKSLIFGYERLINSHQSISVNIGRASFPTLNLINSDSLRVNSSDGEKGFNFSVDYRFYLSKENKYNAPRGVYIGPYYSYNFFEKTNTWALKSSSGGATQNIESKTSLSTHTLGFELGYQFILWKRISLDMILAGPGVSTYNLKASLGSNLSEEDKQKFFEKLNDALAEKFPGYNKIIDEGEFQKKGSANTTSIGFRYMVMIGYRF
ncbi:hypothetical protein [Flavitalea sp.]|nr:hypothetical protein [Flavitalea sp.]